MVTDEDGEEKPILEFCTMVVDDEEVDYNPYVQFLQLHVSYIQGVVELVNNMITFIRELIELEKSNDSEFDNTFKRLLSKLSNASRILLNIMGNLMIGIKIIGMLEKTGTWDLSKPALRLSWTILKKITSKNVPNKVDLRIS